MSPMTLQRRLRVAVVVGTRPEVVKMAPVVRELLAQSKTFDVSVCTTGQHQDLLEDMLQVFDINPDVQLVVDRIGQSLAGFTAATATSIEEFFSRNRPDLVLVHGDTATTLATAITGFLMGIPVGHVEAGLRTHDLDAPYPEEFNRQVVSKAAYLHFAPTELSVSNLIQEGVESSRIFETGNTAVDALNWAVQLLQTDKIVAQNVESRLDNCLKFDWRTEEFVLVTAHRRENQGEGLSNVCDAICTMAALRPFTHFVLPVHPSPAVEDLVRAKLAGINSVHLPTAMDYFSFVALMMKCRLVLTDSGGIQEEAPTLGKPVLVMRNKTERPEAVSAGVAQLVGTNADAIVAGLSQLLDDAELYDAMSAQSSPFGDGTAAKRIVDHIEKWALSNQKEVAKTV